MLFTPIFMVFPVIRQKYPMPNFAVFVIMDNHIIGLKVKADTVNAFIFALRSSKTYSRVVKFALSRCSLVIFVLHNYKGTKLTSFNEWYILQVYLTGQHKNKAGLRQTRVYYPFASTHMVNTQLLRVQNVHTKYRKYFRGFLNSRLLNFREIHEN